MPELLRLIPCYISVIMWLVIPIFWKETTFMLWFVFKLVSYLWWVYPFAFIFFLLAAIQQLIKSGPNDVVYGFGAAVSLFPVSYTHRDVYKRQILEMPMPSTHRPRAKVSPEEKRGGMRPRKSSPSRLPSRIRATLMKVAGKALTHFRTAM